MKPLRLRNAALALAALASLGACTIVAERPRPVVIERRDPPPPPPRHIVVEQRRPPVYAEARFQARQREVAHRYYRGEYRHGRCPPGLAKKRNGCVPPGHARRWQRGRPLPRDVVVHEVPPRLIAEIGPPPRGYRYVQVASDILMIAVGTAVVADAIEDLGR